jgi:hypothetical protein
MPSTNARALPGIVLFGSNRQRVANEPPADRQLNSQIASGRWPIAPLF